MAKDLGSHIKYSIQYEDLRKKGMSKERAARIANAPVSARHGDQNSRWEGSGS